MSLIALLLAALVDDVDERRSRARTNELLNRLGLRQEAAHGTRARMAWVRKTHGDAVADWVLSFGRRGQYNMEATTPGPLDPLIPWLAWGVQRAWRHMPPTATTGGFLGEVHPDTVRRLVHWAHATKPDLMTLPILHALQDSEEWHEALKLTTDVDPAIRLAGTTPIHQWSDDWALVRLGSKEAFMNESAMMGHCIGEGDYYRDNYLSGNGMALSLRDPSGAPHATLWFAVRTESGENRGEIEDAISGGDLDIDEWEDREFHWVLEEAKAKGNSAIPQKYAKRILEWMKTEAGVGKYKVEGGSGAHATTLDFMDMQPLAELIPAWQRVSAEAVGELSGFDKSPGDPAFDIIHLILGMDEVTGWSGGEVVGAIERNFERQLNQKLSDTPWDRNDRLKSSTTLAMGLIKGWLMRESPELHRWDTTAQFLAITLDIGSSPWLRVNVATATDVVWSEDNFTQVLSTNRTHLPTVNLYSAEIPLLDRNLGEIDKIVDVFRQLSPKTKFPGYIILRDQRAGFLFRQRLYRALKTLGTIQKDLYGFR